MPIADLKEMLALTAEPRGRRAPGPGRVNIMISLPPPTVGCLDGLAALMELRRSNVIERLIAEETTRRKM